MNKLLLALLLLLTPLSAVADDCVILLHGLARSAASMEKMQHNLQQANYRVVNVDYESRKHPLDRLAEMAINAGLQQCRSQSAKAC